MDLKLRPIKRFVLLLDDDPVETIVGGIVIKTGIWRTNMDYVVLGIGTNERVDFGHGDRVILRTPDVGRKLRLDGVPMRLVKVDDIIGVVY